MSLLNPEANEFIPYALQQFHVNYPNLSSTQKNNRKKMNKNDLSFIQAAKKPLAITRKPKPLVTLDPSWVVLSECLDQTQEHEQTALVMTTVEEKEPPPQNSLFVSEKPSIRAIDRWKFKWLQVARSVRENLQAERAGVEQRHSDNATSDSHRTWHSILSPDPYLAKMAVPPIGNSNVEVVNNHSTHIVLKNLCSTASIDEFWSAIKSGHVSKLLSMIESPYLNFDWRTCLLSDFDASNKEIKMGPLHIAVSYNQPACVKLFLDSGLVYFNFLDEILGINIECRDSLKRTPVLIAAECGYHEIFHLLIESGSDITVKEKDLNGILHCACYIGQRLKMDRRLPRMIEFVKIVNWIVDRCKSKIININWKNKQRNTPLMVAIEYGNVDIVASLLHAGADPSCVNISQEDALGIAAKRKGNEKILEMLLCSNYKRKSRAAMVPSNRPQKVSEKYMFPISPINLAARNGNIEAIKLLVSYGISLNSFDDYHFIHKGVKFYALTPLMVASIFGFTEIVRYLVSNNLNERQQLQINITDRNGLTALGCACLFGHLDCLNLIAKHCPESLQFSYRYHDFESVPECVVRNMCHLPIEDRSQAIICLSHLISFGCPLSEKVIKKLVSPKNQAILETHTSVPWRWVSLPSPDVSIAVSNDNNELCETYCHSFILRVHSETFLTMLSSTLSNHTHGVFHFLFGHVSEKVLHLILSWMYTGDDVTSTDAVKNSPGLLVDLMIVANEFLILRLQRICEHRLCECMINSLLGADDIHQLKELASLLNLDHLLVYFANERVISPLQQHSIFFELHNSSVNNLDLIYPLQTDLLGHLCYIEHSPSRKKCFEVEFVRHISIRRIEELDLREDQKVGLKSLTKSCLQKVIELDEFNLRKFLLNIYSISTIEPFLLLDESLWNHFLDCQPSAVSHDLALPILAKLFSFMFSSLFEFSMRSWEYLKEASEHSHGNSYRASTSLSDFISHELYQLICRHVILSWSGYDSTSVIDTSLRRDVIIRCDSSFTRRVPRSIAALVGKLDALVRLYSQGDCWDNTVELDDVNVIDVDSLLCFVYVGYIPNNMDENRYAMDKMTPTCVYLTNLLILADEYLMDSLKHTVERILVRFLTPDNCATLFSISSTLNISTLRDAAAHMFLSNYHLYVQQESLNSSSVSQDRSADENRISLFFGESVVVTEFLHYVLSSLLEVVPTPSG